MSTTDDARADERWFRGIDDDEPSTPSPVSASTTDNVYWLIEYRENGQTTGYLQEGNSGYSAILTSESSKALKFYTKAAAVAALQFINSEGPSTFFPHPERFFIEDHRNCSGPTHEEIDAAREAIDRSAASPEGSAGQLLQRWLGALKAHADMWHAGFGGRARDDSIATCFDELRSALPSLIDAANELLELRRVAGLRMPTEEDHLRAQLTEARSLNASLEANIGAIQGQCEVRGEIIDRLRLSREQSIAAIEAVPCYEVSPFRQASFGAKSSFVSRSAVLSILRGAE